MHEFESKRFQRISAQEHIPDNTDTNSIMYAGMAGNIKSRNDIDYYNNPPEQVYLSRNKSKDSLELLLLDELNKVIDQAIVMQNNEFFLEASEFIQTNIFDGLFDGVDPRFIRTDGLGNEYPLEIIPILREGISEYIVNTPGRLKWREVVAEENIDRRNYRNADYRDERDGDFESSIYYSDDGRKNDINGGVRDQSLVMYQNDHEEYNLNGGTIKPNDRTSWPTTLVSDNARVYKGGSWKDRAYWIVGSNKRFMDEELSSATIGFRCAMDRVGSPRGLGKYR